MTGLRAGAATDPGLIRRTNEDQLLVTDDLFAVADGMGGHAGGEVASLTAVEALRVAFGGEADRSTRTVEDLRDAVQQANDAVFARAQAGEELRGMGTTMTAAALVGRGDDERLAVANVGDSRAYVLAQGDLTQLTEDHSVPEELVRLGQLAPEEVATHPQRHMLTRVLGVPSEIDIDLWEIIPFVGDRILLCSDGLCRELTDDQIASVLRRLADPAEAARELVGRARVSGGSDNITAVVIDVVDDGGRSQAASAALGSQPAHLVPPTVATPVDGDRDRAGSGPVESEPAPDSGEEPPAPTPPARRPRVTARVIAFFLVLVLILGGAGYAIYYYARGSFYVGLAAQQGQPTARTPLVIYRGRPGGLLWFHPTVEQPTGLTTADVPSFRVAELRNGKIEPSLAAARDYLRNITLEASALRTGTSPTSVLPPLPRAGTTTVP